MASRACAPRYSTPGLLHAPRITPRRHRPSAATQACGVGAASSGAEANQPICASTDSTTSGTTASCAAGCKTCCRDAPVQGVPVVNTLSWVSALSKRPSGVTHASSNPLLCSAASTPCRLATPGLGSHSIYNGAPGSPWRSVRQAAASGVGWGCAESCACSLRRAVSCRCTRDKVPANSSRRAASSARRCATWGASAAARS